MVRSCAFSHTTETGSRTSRSISMTPANPSFSGSTVSVGRYRSGRTACGSRSVGASAVGSGAGAAAVVLAAAVGLTVGPGGAGGTGTGPPRSVAQAIVSSSAGSRFIRGTSKAAHDPALRGGLQTCAAALRAVQGAVPAVLELEGVAHHFGPLGPLDLRVDEGETLAVIGPSGAG